MPAPEEPGKIICVEEAGLLRDFPDRKPSREQEILRMPQSTQNQVILGWHAGFAPEEFQQMVRRNAERTCDFAHFQGRIAELPVQPAFGLKKEGIDIARQSSGSGLFERMCENFPEQSPATHGCGGTVRHLRKERTQQFQERFALFHSEPDVARQNKAEFRRRRRGRQLLPIRRFIIEKEVGVFQLPLRQTLPVPVEMDAPAPDPRLGPGEMNHTGRNDQK